MYRYFWRRRAVAVKLFGKSEKKHNVSDVVSISMSCGCMDYSYHYSFTLYFENGEWRFSADCFTHDRTEPTEFSDRSVKNDDVKTALDILEKNGVAEYVEKYKPPKKLPFHVLDETTYSFCLGFSDGKRICAEKAGEAQNELNDFFYRLAESYK